MLRDEIMVGFPDTSVFIQRGSLLSVDGNNSRDIRLDFQGADLEALMDAARVAVDEIPKAIPETYPQAFPGLELDQPELQLIPDEWRIARSGLTRTEVAAAVRAFTGGLWAGEYFDGNDRLDIIVKSHEMALAGRTGGIAARDATGRRADGRRTDRSFARRSVRRNSCASMAAAQSASTSSRRTT